MFRPKRLTPARHAVMISPRRNTIFFRPLLFIFFFVPLNFTRRRDQMQFNTASIRLKKYYRVPRMLHKSTLPPLNASQQLLLLWTNGLTIYNIPWHPKATSFISSFFLSLILQLFFEVDGNGFSHRQCRSLRLDRGCPRELNFERILQNWRSIWNFEVVATHHWILLILYKIRFFSD